MSEERSAYLVALESIAAEIVAHAAAEIDRTAAYPRAALDALAQADPLEGPVPDASEA